MINDIPTDMELASYTNNIWQITPSRETKTEDMLKPEFWAHISGRLRGGDRVIAVPVDRSFFVEMFVLASAKNWAKVVLMREITLIEDAEERPAEEGYLIRFAGKHRWRVEQGEHILHKDCDTKEEAEAWLKEHKKGMA